LNAASPEAGQGGIITIGTWPDTDDFYFVYNGSQWVGEALIVVTQGDSWAMDLGNKTAANLAVNAFIDSAVPYGKSYAVLQGAHNLAVSNFNPGTATGVITVDDTTSAHSYAFQTSTAGSPYLQIRDNYLTYTGKTGTTFTGCAVVEGSRENVPGNAYVYQGDVGGWGFVTRPVERAAAMFAAGFTLQERLTSLMNNSPGDLGNIIMSPYWHQYNQGDGVQPRAIVPSGGMGASASLTSLAATGGTVDGERPFYLTKNSWTNWPLTTPTKDVLVPSMVARMSAGGLTGSVLDTMLAVRWVG
jgi:hypothetical protein